MQWCAVRNSSQYKTATRNCSRKRHVQPIESCLANTLSSDTNPTRHFKIRAPKTYVLRARSSSRQRYARTSFESPTATRSSRCATIFWTRRSAFRLRRARASAAWLLRRFRSTWEQTECWAQKRPLEECRTTPNILGWYWCSPNYCTGRSASRLETQRAILLTLPRSWLHSRRLETIEPCSFRWTSRFVARIQNQQAISVVNQDTILQ